MILANKSLPVFHNLYKADVVIVLFDVSVGVSGSSKQM
jgi:hypothetical protein